jgi:uncharacterized Zn-binding protein involved in type VI secretion
MYRRSCEQGEVSMSSVYANGRSILHEGDGLTQISGPPDVCKTPTPGGPVPIPYPNVAMDSDLAQGAKNVKIEGNPVAHEGSNLSTSTGDEAGAAGGGLMSSKTKGKLTFGTSSLDVKVEGKGVARFMEVTQHNGNTFNTVMAATGAAGVTYGDDPIDQKDCLICKEPKSKHELEPDDDILEKAKDLREALQAKGSPFAEAFVRGENSPTPDRPLKPGVMIGVLSCQCSAVKQYAGLAGTKYEDGNYAKAAAAFIDAAGKLGLTPVVTPPAPPPRSGISAPSNKGEPFGTISSEQWAATIERRNEINKKHRGNAPLTCAAPKMIQQCLAEGHKPGRMVEVWVAMEEGSTVTVTRVLGVVLDSTTDPPSTKTDWLHGLELGDGAAIPSCTTCQVICSEMVCNTGQPPCP